MKVLVTGATGFIGTQLVHSLVKKGYEVTIFHRKSSDFSAFKNYGDSVKFVVGHINSIENVNLALSKDIEVVFHLAGWIGYSRSEREMMERVNVGGTQNVIEACLNNNIKRLVYMSSVVAIGASFDKKPLNENSEYNVSHLNLGYFETKKKAEDFVKQACKKRGLNAVIVNPATVYGASDAKKGSRKAQLKVARGQLPFYTLGGVNVVHVDDVIFVLIEAIKTGKIGERYIVGGENILIKDLFRMIAEEAGVKPPKIPLNTLIVKALGFVGDILEKFEKKGVFNSETAWTSSLYHWFENKKVCREFGFTPKSAREAIRDSVLWSQKNLK